MLLRRRHLIGSLLAAGVVGSALALEAIGPVTSPDPLEVRFTRAVSLAQGEQARIAAFAAENIAEPRILYHVTGHTGDRGDADANTALSLQRAEAIAKLLVDSGVDPESILTVQGVGSAKPLTREQDESDAAHQRRMARAVIAAVVRK